MQAMRLYHPAGLDNLRLECDDKNACPEFSSGWEPVFVNKSHDNKELERAFDSIKCHHALEACTAPPPGPGEVRVQIKAAALNFRDSLVVRGIFPAKDGLIPLSDACGVVQEIGAGVTAFKPGDRVLSLFHPNWQDGHIDRVELNNAPGAPADGFAATHTTKPASHFTRAPQGLSDAEAASLTCAGVTAWRAVITDGKVMPGATVLVQGTGGVSLFALQFAKMAGARVIATTGDAAKRERLIALGADHVLDYRDANWGAAALELTGGLGVDHVIEVGGPYTIGQSFIAARTGAHVAIIGAAGGFDIDTMPFAIVQAKRLRLQSVTVGSRRDQLDMIRAIELHGLKPVLDQNFTLPHLADAFRHLDSGKHFGKVTISIT